MTFHSVQSGAPLPSCISSLSERALSGGSFDEYRRPPLSRAALPHFGNIREGRRTGMKIAQIAPLYESVPPKFYGGTERVVSYLSEELVKQGHDVTLFASADSKTAAELRP